MRYHVMRRDEHGNDSFVSCWCSPEAALAEQVRRESGVHKQIYWVETLTTCECPSRSPS